MNDDRDTSDRRSCDGAEPLDAPNQRPRWRRHPIGLGCLLLVGLFVAAFAWRWNQLRLERQAVEALRSANVQVSMSNVGIFGISVGEYPSALFFGPWDAATVDWSLIRRFRRIDQVQLEGTRNVDLALEELATVRTLRNVFLDDSDVTAYGLKSLSKNPAPMSLSLAGTTLSRGATHAIAAFPGIYRLNLSGARFDSAWLSVLHGHPSLKVLDLRETEVDDEDIEVLAGLVGWELLILDESRMTEQGIMALRRRLPGVRVHWNGRE